MLKPILIVAGFISLALGVLGIVLPVLPTTPFVLLSGACFASGSRRLYRWLSSTKNFGPMLRHFKTGEGISAGVRKRALLTLWGGLGLSALLVRRWPIWPLLAAVGVGVTIFLCRMKTRAEEENTSGK